jgi:hypothetical protein
MKKILSLYIAWSIFQFASAQENSLLLKSERDTKASITSANFIALQSSGFTNELIKKFYFGGLIESDIISNSTQKLSSKNTIGENLSLSLEYRTKLKQKNENFAKRWLAGIRSQQILIGEYSSDAFRFFFQGNKNFEDKTMNLAPNNFLGLEWKTVYLGTEMVKGNSEFGIQLGLNLGNQLYDISIPEGALFTAKDGIELNGKIKLNAFTNSSVTYDYFAVNGYGMNGAAYYSKNLNQGKTKITIGIQDLGFIKWNKNISEKTIDSNFVWRGVAIENIFDSIKADINGISDLENTWIHEKENATPTTLVPTRIYIQYRSLLTSKIELQSSLQYTISKVNSAYINTGINYQPSTKWIIGFIAGYGNYGKFHAGINTSFYLSNNLLIEYFGHSLATEFLAKNRAYFNHGLKVRLTI